MSEQSLKIREFPLSKKEKSLDDAKRSFIIHVNLRREWDFCCFRSSHEIQNKTVDNCFLLLQHFLWAGIHEHILLRNHGSAHPNITLPFDKPITLYRLLSFSVSRVQIQHDSPEEFLMINKLVYFLSSQQCTADRNIWRHPLKEYQWVRIYLLILHLEEERLSTSVHLPLTLFRPMLHIHCPLSVQSSTNLKHLRKCNFHTFYCRQLRTLHRTRRKKCATVTYA